MINNEDESTGLNVSHETGLSNLSDRISVPQYEGDQLDLDSPDLAVYSKIEDEKAGKEEETRALIKNEEEGTPSQPKIDPLKFWDNSIKQTFNSQSSQVKSTWLKSFSIIEKQYKKMGDALKTAYSHFDKLSEVLEPIIPELQKLNIEPEAYIKGLIEADLYASTAPVDYILKLMAMKKVNYDDLTSRLPSLLDQETENYKLAPLQERITQLETRLDGPKIRYEQLPISSTPSSSPNDDEVAAQIDSFFSQVKPDGSPMYPGAQELYEQIVSLLMEGKADSLEAAYVMATEEVKGAKLPASNLGSSIPDYQDARATTEILNRQQEVEMLTNILDQMNTQQ